MDLILYFITKNLESKLIHTTGIQCMYSNVFSPITIANNRQKVINEKTKYSTNDNEVKIVKIDMLSIHRHYRQVYSPLRAFIDRVDNENNAQFLGPPCMCTVCCNSASLSILLNVQVFISLCCPTVAVARGYRI